jgi:lipopolysaccharide transport system ATP-binding protein
MYVRLAFAVAAHLEPEILIVDEVLAVGDMAFQKKCMGKMSAVAREQRTILFVSHNMSAVRALCTKGLILDQGKIVFEGSAHVAANTYMNATQGTLDISQCSLQNRAGRTSGAIRFTSFRFEDEHGSERSEFQQGSDVRLVLQCKAYRAVPDLGIVVQMRIANEQITSIKTILSDSQVIEGTEMTVVLTLPEIPLRPGAFSFYVCLGNAAGDRFHDVIDQNVSLPVLSISAEDTDLHTSVGYFSIPWHISVKSSAAESNLSGAASVGSL